ncbi:hypothetical protein CCUS01_15835 [Colletotrichum cuscutae]|uniref:UbiA prenyltransferase n=1 Tax=Colletotrichum cuscutae TaxID=1209917 RepID=A0AAI9VEM7_9PEZI|nr:hypothetical protein CCUS01_15835 [Colletotrichum cuscutae]
MQRSGSLGENCPLTLKHASFEDEIVSSSTKSSSSCSSSTFTEVLRIPRLIWDFTESNFATFVVPNTAFGLLGGLTGAPLTSGHAATLSIVQRFPLVVAFNWYSVLIFDLANQRGPESVAEDLANKPWRPIPAGKVTPEQTRKAMLVAIPAVLALNYVLDVWEEGVFILILTWLYNDLRGGDELVRDAIIAVAYFLFNTASLKIAISGGAVAEAAAGAADDVRVPITITHDGPGGRPRTGPRDGAPILWRQGLEDVARGAGPLLVVRVRLRLAHPVVVGGAAAHVVGSHGRRGGAADADPGNGRQSVEAVVPVDGLSVFPAPRR